jgi:hypothetical protein
MAALVPLDRQTSGLNGSRADRRFGTKYQQARGRLAPPRQHRTNNLIPLAREGRPKTAAPVLDFSFLRPTKSYAPNNELRGTHRSAQSMAYKFRTNSRSHELWREKAWERAKTPPGDQGKSGAMADKSAITGPLRGQPGPQRLFA